MLMYAGLGATAAITDMQKALVALAQAAGKPEINPGPPTGVVDTRTIGAVAAMLAWGANRIPQDETAKYLRKSIKWGGYAAIIAESTAAPIVAQYAPWIKRTAASLTLMLAQGVIKAGGTTAQDGPGADGGGGGGGGAATKAWYETPEGMVGLLLAAVIGYKLLMPKA